MPAVFLFYAKSLQAIKRSRQILHANLAGLSLALCLLAGHHQPVMYTSLAILAISLAFWFSRSLRKALESHITHLTKGQKEPVPAPHSCRSSTTDPYRIDSDFFVRSRLQFNPTFCHS